MKPRPALAAGAVAVTFGAAAWVAARGLAVDYSDGGDALLSALGLLGHGFPIVLTRPPLHWAATVPAALFYASGGPLAALRADHALMCVYAAAAVWTAGWYARRLLPPRAALFAVAFAALNPLAVAFAPFGLFDVTAGIFAAVFAALAWRALSRPSPRSLLWALAAYVVAVLARYQASLLMAAPLAWALLEPGSLRSRAQGVARRWPLWLGVPLAYAALMAVAVASSRWPGQRPLALAQAHRAVWQGVMVKNLSDPAPFWTYGVSLWRQQGATGLLLCVLGCVVSLRRGGEARFAALCFLAPAAILTFVIGVKEGRYLLMLAPFSAAAAAAGFEAAVAAARPARVRPIAAGALALGCLGALAVPAAQAWGRVARSRGARSPLAAQLSRQISSLPPWRCARWTSALSIPDAGADKIRPSVGPETMSLYLGPASDQRLMAADQGRNEACRAGLLIDGERRGVYEFEREPKPRQRLLWTVDENGLSARAARAWEPLPLFDVSAPPAAWTSRGIARESAIRLQELGLYRAAEAVHSRLIAEAPGDWQAYSDRAVCRALHGDLEGAGADARAAIERRPTSRQPYLTLDFIAAAQGKKP